ncbi:hypothetical protein TNCV_6641 [Trichonephila clavipes]|nr:hypothetical protein TNCV_6641 [Trichonephila clavipes]
MKGVLSFRTISFQARRVPMGSIRRVEDSEHWRAVGRIEAGCHTCCSFLWSSSFRHFTAVETILKKPNSCPRICSLSSKGYDPRKDILLL